MVKFKVAPQYATKKRAGGGGGARPSSSSPRKRHHMSSPSSSSNVHETVKAEPTTDELGPLNPPTAPDGLVTSAPTTASITAPVQPNISTPSVNPAAPEVQTISEPTEEEEEEEEEKTPKKLTPEDIQEMLRSGMFETTVGKTGHIISSIDMGEIPRAYQPPKGMEYIPRSVPGAPEGVEQFIRDAFRIQRESGSRTPQNILLTGPPGCGKTTSAQFFAQESNLPLWKTPGENIDPKVLLGKTTLVADGQGGTRTVFVEGIIPRAVRNGGVLLLDEVNAYPQDVQIRLNELLDDSRTLTMQEELDEEGNPIIIHAHPDLLVIGSQNPPTSDATNQLIPQLRSRFTKNLWLPSPSDDDMLKIVKSNLSLTDDALNKISSDLKRVMRLCNQLRDLNDRGEISYAPTVREVVAVAADLKSKIKLEMAVAQDIYNKYYDADDRDKVRQKIKDNLSIDVNR